ncbi:MAG: kelch repeat-containing protein [Terriglobales bacterium]
MKTFRLLLIFVYSLCLLNACGGGGRMSVFTPTPLTIISGAPPNGTLATVYDGSSGFPLSALGGTQPYTWSWAAAAGSSVPPGLNLSNGSVTGTPTTAGTYNVIVTVTDSESPAAHMSADYTIIVAALGGLTISSGVPPNGTVDVVYDQRSVSCRQGSPGCGCRDCYCHDGVCWRLVSGFTFTASGGVGGYAWTVSALPPGLSLSNDTIIGTPPSGSEGTYNVLVTVTDSATPAGKATADYTVVINPPPPPAIITQPTPYSPAVNSPYNFTFTATGGQAPLTWGETGALPPGLSFSTGGVLSGTPIATSTGPLPITVTVRDSANQTSAPATFNLQVFQHGFSPTGSMAALRVLHAASLLGSGKVLITGGGDGSGDVLATAELFDPSTGTFTATANMSSGRINHTSTLLNTGKVLVAGGGTVTAELFDPANGTFALTGSMETARYAATATLLNNGKVLVSGGTVNGTALATAELYDPSNGTFTPTSNLITARSSHTATLLGSGKVLLTGGLDASGQPLVSAELFDPTSVSFSSTGSMGTARASHAATALSSGEVLVEGGFDANSSLLVTAETFNPNTGSFAATGSMTMARASHTATLLHDGTVLIAGPDQTAELFNPGSGTFVAAGSMTTARASHTATLPSNGTVLVTGGQNTNTNSATVALASADLYQ